MGLFGGSKSSSSSQVINEDKRNVSDNGGVSLSGDNNTILDGGAIAQSFDFARDFSRDSNALSGMVIEKAFKTSADNSQSAFNAALQAVQPQPIDIKLVAVAAAAVVALFYFASK